MSTTEKEQCFIITPIGEDNAPIRRHIDGIIDAAIIPALGEKYDVKAAHHTKQPGTITKQVIEAIYNAKLVIANLTERNPNVMYELALRHAIGKPAIMIVERGTPIPSDIIMQRTISYYNDAKGVLELQEELKNAESEIDFEAKSGPIFDVLGDITRDTNMLKEAAESKAGSQEPLAYIMQRLDRIENSISHSSSKNRLMKNLQELRFTYDAYSGPGEEELNMDELSEVENVFSGVSLEETSLRPSSKLVSGKISIIIDVYYATNPPKEVTAWLQKCLLSMGFEKAKYIGRTKVDILL